MKNVFVLGFLICSLSATAQKKVTFRVAFHPNKIYKLTTTSSSSSTMDFSGDEEIINSIKQSGTILPMKIESINTMSSVTKTGNRIADGTIPATITFGKTMTTYTTNGREQIQENPISGMLIEGSYDQQGKLRVDTLISDRVNDELRQMFKSFLEKFQQAIQFPEKPMQIGDSFEQQVPMELPIFGAGSVSMIITTNYKLKEITNGKAVFDILQKVSMNMNFGGGDQKLANTAASGEGSGESEFDLKEETITRYDSKLSIKMKMNIDSLVIAAEIDMKTNQIITVE